MASPALALVDESGRRQPRRFNFTTKRLADLPKPGTGRVFFYDLTLPGLAVMLTATGSASWYIYKRIHGQPVKYRIDDMSAIGLDDARKIAAAKMVEIAAGKDIVAEKRLQREGLTFGEAFAHYLETHAKPKKKTWKEDQRKCEVFLSAWANRRLDQITGKDAAALHARVGKGGIERKDADGDVKVYGGKGVANRLMALVSVVFSMAREQLGYKGENPVQYVRRFSEAHRERFLQADELPRFLDAVNQENPTIRDFILIALFTGARRANVQSMKWEDIDIAGGVWRIPMTKTGDPLTVPLSPQAVEILKARKKEQVNAAAQKTPPAEPSEYVFPSHRSAGKHPHLTEPKSAWKRICKRAKLADLRVHDLRHTFASWQVNAGASLKVVGQALGHRKTQTTNRYAHLLMAPVRQSVDAATAAIASAMNATPKTTK